MATATQGRTAAERCWLESRDPLEMLGWLSERPGRGSYAGISERKARLFCVACALRRGGDPRTIEDVARTTGDLAAWARRWADSVTNTASSGVPQAVKAGVLRDLLGNPFRPAESPWKQFAFLPSGPTEQILALARSAYDERNADGSLDAARLGVLSDALEEAGCGGVELLGHLRSPGPHYRGCWALDLVLGKE